MKASKFTDEQVAMALRQAETGTPVGEICRKLSVREQSFYRWENRFGALGVSKLWELRQPREENRKLKGLVADLSLDKKRVYRLYTGEGLSLRRRRPRRHRSAVGPGSACRRPRSRMSSGRWISCTTPWLTGARCGS